LRESQPIEVRFEQASESLRFYGSARAEENVRASDRLTDLILDDSHLSTEHGPKRVRMDDGATRIPEYVVEAALDVGDSPVGRPTRARLGEERHLVRDLVANEWKHRVEQIREVHLRRLGAARHYIPVLVDGFDDEEIVGEVHPRATIAPTRHDAALG